MTPSRETLARATAALKKLKGTYVTRHAEAIASAALSFADPNIANDAVNSVVGHTATGRRNVGKWTRIARQAAGMSIPT